MLPNLPIARTYLVEIGRYVDLTSGDYVSEAVMEHIRPRELSLLILAK